MRRTLGTALRIALCLLAVAFASRAQAAEPKKLKVIVLGVTGGEGFTQKQLGTIEELVLDSLHKAPAMEVTGRADLAALLGYEQQKQLLGCNEDSSCLAELAGATGADLIAQGDVGRLGTVTVVSLKMIDSQKAKVLARASRKITEDAELPDAVEELTGEVVAVVRGEPPPPPKQKPAAKKAEEPAGGMTLRLMPSFSTHVYLTDTANSTVGGGLQASMNWGAFVLVPALRYGTVLGSGDATTQPNEYDVAVEAGLLLDSKTVMSFLSTVAPGVASGSKGDGPSTKVGLLVGPAFTVGQHASFVLRGRALVLVDVSRLFIHAALGGDYEFTATRTPMIFDLGLGWRF